MGAFAAAFIAGFEAGLLDVALPADSTAFGLDTDPEAGLVGTVDDAGWDTGTLVVEMVVLARAARASAMCNIREPDGDSVAATAAPAMRRVVPLANTTVVTLGIRFKLTLNSPRYRSRGYVPAPNLVGSYRSAVTGTHELYRSTAP